MEQKDIDIYEILKGMPDGTPLYTPMCGNVEFTSAAADKEKMEAIWTEDKNGEYSFDKHGKYYLWKQIDNVDYSKEESQMVTSLFEKVNDYEAQTYISTIEERLGGKLNRETLEIEKPEKLTFEIGKLYVFDEEDEDGNVTVIGELIGKNESEDTLSFGDQYEIENEKFVTDQAFDLRISVHEELREATENEVELFNKHYSIWKEAKEQPAFKPFDKVLVRTGERCNWLPAFFVRDRGESFAWRYKVLPIHSGTAGDFHSCIPFEGHEHLAFTSDPLQRAYGE